MQTNRFGVVDPAGSNGILRFAGSTSGAVSGNVSYLLAGDIVARASENASLFLQQLYGELHAGGLLFRAGRKEDTVGLVAHDLSLGSMTLGKNASPVTMVSLSIPEYVDVPGTKGFVGFRGQFGHGWMTGDRVVSRSYLHEKYLYLRFGKAEWGVLFYGGLTHFSEWGGTHPNPEFGHLPSSFNDYLRIIFAQRAAKNSTLFLEEENLLGNSLGAYDMRLDIVRPHFTLSVYRQFYLEDTVSILLRNTWDGLWGVLLRFPNERPVFRSLLWEHVNTKQQGSMPSERLGTDNYYNHVLYGSGWTNRGRSLGLPLMFTGEGFEGVVNNIVVAHHIGLAGSISAWLDYTAFATFSRNYGVHTLIESGTLRRYETDLPLQRKDQYSLGVNLRASLSSQYGLTGLFQVAYDWGQLLPDHNVGVAVGIRKEGVF